MSKIIIAPKLEKAFMRLGAWVYADQKMKNKLSKEVYEVYSITHKPIIDDCINECFKLDKKP